jgi:hypothetical protein
MSHMVLSSAQTEVNRSRLEGLIATVMQAHSGQMDLLIEHLRSARTYLLGAMPEEYAGALRDARDAASQVKENESRRTLRDAIDHLLMDISHAPAVESTEPVHHAHLKRQDPSPPGATSQLWHFFNGSDASFGVFYPRGHIVAIFPSLDVAKRAEAVVRNIGFKEHEVLAIAAEEMLQFLSEFELRAGLWGMLMRRLSRMFGTEEMFVDNDIRRARQGAGFLAIYSPDDAECEWIRHALEEFRPLSMQRYLASGIQSLI